MAKELKVTLTLDSKEFEKSLKEAGIQVEGMKAPAMAAESGFTAMAAAMAVGTLAADAFKAALSKTVALMGDSIKEAAQAEQAQLRFAQALASRGQLTAEAVRSANALAREIQSLTTFTDEEVLSVQRFLVSIGGLSTKELPAATKATADLAAGLGIDLEQAARLMSKAAAGNEETLGRLGIRIKENIPEAEKFAAVMDQVREKFGGAAQAEALTFAGALKQTQNAWSDMLEAVGNFLVKEPAVKAFFLAIKDTLVEFTKAIDESRGKGDHLTKTIGDIVTSLGPLLSGLNVAILVFQEVGNAIVALIEFALVPAGFMIDLFVKAFEAMGVAIGAVLMTLVKAIQGWVKVVRVAADKLGLDSVAEKMGNVEEGVNAAMDSITAKTLDFSKKFRGHFGEVTEFLTKQGISNVKDMGTAWDDYRKRQDLVDSATATFAKNYEKNLKEAKKAQDETFGLKTAPIKAPEIEPSETVGAMVNLPAEPIGQTFEDFKIKSAEALLAFQDDQVKAQESTDIWLEQQMASHQLWLESWTGIKTAAAEQDLEFLTALSEHLGVTTELWAAQWQVIRDGGLMAFDSIRQGLNDTIFAFITGTGSLAEVWKGVANTLLKTTIDMLTKMAAQWLVFNVLRMALNRQESAAAVGGQAAAAYMGEVAFFAPFSGPAAPALAGGVMAGAFAGAAGAGAAGMGVGASFEVGSDFVGQTGPALIHRGERVVPQQTNLDLTEFLRSQQQGDTGPRNEINITVGEMVGDQESVDRLVKAIDEAITLRNARFG